MATITVSPCILDWAWKEDGTTFFRVRITFNRKTKYIKTNVRVSAADLDRNGRIKNTVRRRELEDFVRKIEDAAARLDTYALRNMTLDDVVKSIERTMDGAFSLDFFQFAEEECGKKSRSSRGVYVSAVKALKEFVGSPAMDISMITSSFLRDWEEWLTDKYGKGARSVSSYTAAIRYIHGRARLRYNDEETGYVPIRNPYVRYSPPTQKPARHRPADPDVIQKMIGMRESLTGRERFGVDLFLASFALMGMNNPDLYDAKEAKDGIITYFRQKTRDRRYDGAEMHVRIEDCALRILAGYAASGTGKAFTFSDMYTSYTIMGENANKGLAKFAERIGYTERLTMYTARHAWATCAYRAGVDKGVINDCLCHVDREMRVTDIYIQKDWSVMWEANRKVLAMFEW